MLRFDDYPGAKKYLLKIYRYRKKDPIKEKATRDLADGKLVDTSRGDRMERVMFQCNEFSLGSKVDTNKRRISDRKCDWQRNAPIPTRAWNAMNSAKHSISNRYSLSSVIWSIHSSLSSWDMRKTCNSIRVKWLWSIRHWAVSVKNCKNGKRVSIISDVRWVVALVWAHELMSK